MNLRPEVETMSSKGQNLIFIICQPRSGSTLLQRILGSHPDIHTVSEPWIMLHPIYALRENGYSAAYSSKFARAGLNEFLSQLPNGAESYYEAVRRMYAYLYQQALDVTGKRLFIDKTPIYYLIIPELYRIFPDAKFVFILRNPLAVLMSLLNIRGAENLLTLRSNRIDLVNAPHLLLEGIRGLGPSANVVHYERLVQEPEREIRQLCESIGVDFKPAMIEYGKHELPHWNFGDPEVVYRHSRPVADQADRWIEQLNDPQDWRLASDYLSMLGEETVSELGYSFTDLKCLVDARKPGSKQLYFTYSLPWLLGSEYARLDGTRCFGLSGLESLKRKGLRQTVARGLLLAVTRGQQNLTRAVSVDR